MCYGDSSVDPECHQVVECRSWNDQSILIIRSILKYYPLNLDGCTIFIGRSCHIGKPQKLLWWDYPNHQSILNSPPLNLGSYTIFPCYTSACHKKKACLLWILHHGLSTWWPMKPTFYLINYSVQCVHHSSLQQTNILIPDLEQWMNSHIWYQLSALNWKPTSSNKNFYKIVSNIK